MHHALISYLKRLIFVSRMVVIIFVIEYAIPEVLSYVIDCVINKLLISVIEYTISELLSCVIECAINKVLTSVIESKSVLAPSL